MFRLTISCEDTNIGEEILKHHTVTLGRKPDNDIRIDDSTVSNYHAQIIDDEKTASVEDLNSTNGTYVNGSRISKHTLSPGDVIVIGKHTLVYDREMPKEVIESDPTLQLNRKDIELLLASAVGKGSSEKSKMSAIAKTINWVAQDKNGIWWGFEGEPLQDDEGWSNEEGGHQILLKKETPGSSWQETLHKI